jgi:hypothetical protein
MKLEIEDKEREQRIATREEQELRRKNYRMSRFLI